MVEPTGRRGRREGETVLLVRREGDIFIGLARADGLAPRLDEPLGALR
jgi:hypothetical protein